MALAAATCCCSERAGQGRGRVKERMEKRRGREKGEESSPSSSSVACALCGRAGEKREGEEEGTAMDGCMMVKTTRYSIEMDSKIRKQCCVAH